MVRVCGVCMQRAAEKGLDPPLHDQPPGPGGILFEICPPVGYFWWCSCHY